MAKTKKTSTRVAVILMLLMGLVFASVGAGFSFFSYDFSKNAIATIGTVIDVEVNWSSSSNSSSQSPTYQPTIAFVDASGVKHSGQTFLSSSSYNFERGAQVQILYDARTPSKLRIDSWFALWGFGLIFFVVGIITLVGAIVLWRVKARAKPEPATKATAPAKQFSYSSNASRKVESAEDHQHETDYVPTVRR